MFTGWLPDPYGRYERRYWDGERWSEHVTNGALQGVDPVDALGERPKPAEAFTPEERAAIAAARASHRTASNRSALRLIAIPAVVIVVVVIGLAVYDNTASNAECLPVGAEFTEIMRIGSSAAVQSSDVLGEGGSAWYVSTPGGATWATSADPTGPTWDVGLTIPLNREAKDESSFGSAIGPNAPAFGETSAGARDARRSRECAERLE